MMIETKKEYGYMVKHKDGSVIGYCIAKNDSHAKKLGLEGNKAILLKYTDMRVSRCKTLDNCGCETTGYFGLGSFFDITNKTIISDLLMLGLGKWDRIVNTYNHKGKK